MVAATLNLTLGAIQRPFAYRKGTVDEVVIARALKVGAYDVTHLRRGGQLIALYEQLAAGGALPLVVDAAANIGAAAVFFAHKFPKARIIALEADPARFALLSANVAGLSVECIQATIAAERGDDAAASCVTVNDIYAGADGADPFIVKLDVEAGDLFTANIEWLERTPVVVACLSDYLVPGTAASRRFVKHAVGWDRDFIFAEDNVFSLSRARAHAVAS